MTYEQLAEQFLRAADHAAQQGHDKRADNLWQHAVKCAALADKEQSADALVAALIHA